MNDKYYQTFGEYLIECSDEALNLLHTVYLDNSVIIYDKDGKKLAPIKWERPGEGFGFNVNKKFHTYVRCWTEKIEGHTFTFYTPSTTYVDWDAIDEYLKENAKESKKVEFSRFNSILWCRNSILGYNKDIFHSLK